MWLRNSDALFHGVSKSRTTFEMADANGHSSVPLSGRVRDQCCRSDPPSMVLVTPVEALFDGRTMPEVTGVSPDWRSLRQSEPADGSNVFSSSGSGETLSKLGTEADSTAARSARFSHAWAIIRSCSLLAGFAILWAKAMHSEARLRHSSGLMTPAIMIPRRPFFACPSTGRPLALFPDVHEAAVVSSPRAAAPAAGDAPHRCRSQELSDFFLFLTISASGPQRDLRPTDRSNPPRARRRRCWRRQGRLLPSQVVRQS